MASDGCQPLMMNGRMRGFNPDNVRDSASGLRFPASATSYGQLREMQQGQGAPHGRASTMGTRDVSDDPEFRTRALYGASLPCVRPLATRTQACVHCSWSACP